VLGEVIEHGRRVVDLQREGESGMQALELGQDRHDVVGAVRAHPQMAAGQGAAAGQKRAGFFLRRH
jgi:hypothetical protein